MGLFDIFKKKSMTSNVIEKQLVVTPTPSTTETSEETCDIKNQSFWLLNEKYEPLPKLTLIKKGYRSVANAHGQSELFVLVSDSKKNTFVFHGEIGNYGHSFKLFPLNQSSTFPNIDAIKKAKEFLKNYYDSNQKVLPLLLSKNDYNTLANTLTFCACKTEKCVCCGKETSVWWRNISGTYCYECVKEKIVINNPIVEVKD